MSLVLDSSATLAWVFGDEASDAVALVFEEVAARGAVVPSLWRLEVANVLSVAVRRQRIDLAFRQAALEDLALLDIAVDGQTDERAWADILAFADRYRLTVYDAAYLEVALRRGLALATLDLDLRAAGEKAGVRLMGV